MSIRKYWTFNALATHLGRRPLLIILIIFGLGLFLSILLVRFVKKTSDTPPFLLDLTASEAATVLGVFISIVWGALLWRTASVNAILRRKIYERFRQAAKMQDSQAKQEIRNLVREMNMRGNLYQKLAAIIRHVPQPFLATILLLTTALLIRFLTFQLFKISASGIWRDLIFANTPWLIALGVGIGLIFMDIWALDILEEKILSISVARLPDADELLQKFKNQLTETERKVMEMRKIEGRSHKQISDEMHKSIPTVKTYINHINRKWKNFQQEQKIFIPLEALLKEKNH